MRMPNLNIQELSRDYCGTYGLPVPSFDHYVPLDKNFSVETANAFEALPDFDPTLHTHLAYAKLAYEIDLQFQFLLQAGYTFTPTSDNPYANSDEMCADVAQNKHLYYFTGGETHPLLGETNNTFRAVHDVFGHACNGFQFGARGEYNAWLAHSMMFSPTAQRALTSETHGQNSWVNFGPYSHLPVKERPFAKQKVALLPGQYCNWRYALKRGLAVRVVVGTLA